MTKLGMTKLGMTKPGMTNPGMTQPGVTQIPALTCGRALFAGWVFAYHVDLQSLYAARLGLAPLVHRGAMGVDGFFILSGMVLAYAHPHLRPRPAEARAFLLRRLLRIYPVHLVTIGLLGLLIGAAALLGLHPREPGRFGAGELWRHLLLLHAWGVSDRWAWNYPSWSISAEWAGYLMFPVLWPALRRQGGAGLAVVLVLALAGIAAAQAHARTHGLSLTYDGGLLRFFPEFIAGMASVPLIRRLAAHPAVPGPWVAAAGSAIVLACAWQGRDTGVVFGLWLALCGLLLGGLQGHRSRLAAVPGLHWLGEISYSFYMSFALVETAQATLWRRLATAPPDHPLIYGLTTTAATLALGALLWALVERPALRLAHWRRGTPALLAATGAIS